MYSITTIAEIMIWDVLYGRWVPCCETTSCFLLMAELASSRFLQNTVYNYQTTFHNTAIIIYTAPTASCPTIIACVTVTFLTGDEV
jgi:hypothetical protein